MDIHPSLTSRSKLNKPGVARTAAENKALSQSIKAREGQSAPASSDISPSQLQEGQVVKGRIIDHRYNEVRIELEPDKQIVHARLTGNIPLSIGEEARFQVTGDSPERLTLKYIPEAAASADPTVQKALTASGFPMTERNKQIVEELLRHTMPVDKQTLQTLIQLSHTHREASPLTLVLMYKNNIPMLSSNIKQFQAYQNGTGQLLGDIHSAVKGLTELLKPGTLPSPSPDIPSAAVPADGLSLLQLPANGLPLPNSDASAGNPLSRMLLINRELTDLLYGTGINYESGVRTPLAQIFSQEELVQLAREFEPGLPASAISGSAPGLPSGPVSFLPAGLGSLSLEDAASLAVKLYSGEEQPLSPQQISQTGSAPTPSQPSMPELISVLLEKYTSAASAPVSQHLAPAELAALLEGLRTAPGAEAMAAKVTDGSVSSGELLLFLRESLPGMGEETAGKLLSSPEYLKLLEGAFLDKWTVTPDQLMKKSAVKELYQHLSEDAEQLASLTRLGKPDGEERILQEPVKNLQDNLRFLKDLNEAFTYLQLPVQLKEQTVHSELYVYTRKKALQNGENLSVLLHLDMPHLGSMNIRIQMEHNTIHAAFCLEDEAAQGILSEYMPTLANSLAKKGYHLLSEVTKTYEKVDFSRDFIEEKAGEGEIRRYSFDIRT